MKKVMQTIFSWEYWGYSEESPIYFTITNGGLYSFSDSVAVPFNPTLFGDGIVDVQDLIVLAEHLFEEVARRRDALDYKC
jgi:hypothetical protein